MKILGKSGDRDRVRFTATMALDAEMTTVLVGKWLAPLF
jgi:hypothetical protein